MGTRPHFSHPGSPVVLPEQSAYEKFIKSPFQRGRLSHFICHCVTGYAKHAGKSQCADLLVSPPPGTVDISFIS